MSDSALVPKVWPLLTETVERGVLRGWRWAHKYTVTPDADTIRQEIEDGVLHEICEAFEIIQPKEETDE